MPIGKMNSFDSAIYRLESASTTAGLRITDMRRMIREALLELYTWRNKESKFCHFCGKELGKGLCKCGCQDLVH